MGSVHAHLKIGLLGFGSMGRTHTWAVQNLPFFYGELPFTVETVGVCTTSLQKSERIAREFGLGRGVCSEDELIEDPSVDILDICTPNLFHFDTLKKALLAGKHILCEKPLCVSAEQADEIASLAKGTDLIGGMVFQNRRLAPVQRAKQLIDEGRIGRILHFHAAYLHNSCIDPERRVGWKQDKSVCGGGVLFDLGSHAVDLMRWLCGEFRAVSGHAQIAYPSHLDANGNPWQTNADEAFYLHAVTREGAHGTIEVSKITLGVNDDLSFAIYGEKGSLRFSLMDPNTLWFYDGSAPTSPIGGESGFTAIACVGRYPDMIFPSPKAPAGWLYGHLANMYDYLSAVAEKKRFSPDLCDGAAVQRILDAAYRSDLAGGALTEVWPCS